MGGWLNDRQRALAKEIEDLEAAARRVTGTPSTFLVQRLQNLRAQLDAANDEIARVQIRIRFGKQ
ncbi:hypothetical protein FRC02_009221 [Tulasnella sp. 418]|nr:hypothetical protein FRC02_009221 [Tulasnella sp. 418]